MTSATFHSLCGICQGIIDTIQEVRWHTNLVHHQSRISLERSARNHCGICTELLQHLRNTHPGQISDIWDTLFPIKCESDTSSASWQSSFEMTLVSSGLASFELRFIFEIIKAPKGNQFEYKPAAKTSSPESWELIRHWLKQCTENHARCNALVPEPWAPTRLLDIGTSEDDDIRLVERDESLFGNQPYATLSHCWGSHGITKTMSSNIEQLRHGIPYSSLSKTFCHAIEIVRTLCLRYVWIDSLCVVQDSFEDWSRESSLMSQVYRYCFINIAATGASDSTEGCYWERDPVTILPTEVSVQWSNSPQSTSIVYHVVPEPHIWARKLLDQPLNQRGWVLQERILSPRVLHFGREQLFWECWEFVACETYHRGLPTSLGTNTLIDIKSLPLGDERQDKRWPAKYVLGEPPGEKLIARLWNAFTKLFRPVICHEITLNTTVKKASVFQNWDAVVELYTLGTLTFEGDKLPALAGLAKSIALVEPGEPGDGYLAGLWQSSLPAYLLWTTEIAEVIRGSERQSEKLIPATHRTYVAPTWSWASISGKISLAWCQHNYNPKDYLAELEHAEVRPESFRFGRVLSGLLKLSAPIAFVLWEAADDPSLVCPSAGRITHIFPGRSERYLSIFTRSDTSSDPEIFFDTTDNSTEELTLLPVVGITKRSAHEKEAVIGIILKQSEAGESFVRVGLFYTMRPQVRRILRNMPRQSVTII